MYRKYFDYYLELERDFFVTEPYVLIDKNNYGAFSVQYNRIFQSICSEIDCLLKVLCMCLEPESKVRTLGTYYSIIKTHFKHFNTESVYFNKSKIELFPWREWRENKAPNWWTMYNKVKHHRMEIDPEANKPYYKYANLENVLNALAALYIVEQYYNYAYLKNGREDERENAMLENQSGKCCMKRWRDAGCYSEFMGQFFFDLQKLEKIIGEEREL